MTWWTLLASPVSILFVCCCWTHRDSAKLNACRGIVDDPSDLSTCVTEVSNFPTQLAVDFVKTKSRCPNGIIDEPSLPDSLIGRVIHSCDVAFNVPPKLSRCLFKERKM